MNKEIYVNIYALFIKRGKVAKELLRKLFSNSFSFIYRQNSNLKLFKKKKNRRKKMNEAKSGTNKKKSTGKFI